VHDYPVTVSDARSWHLAGLARLAGVSACLRDVLGLRRYGPAVRITSMTNQKGGVGKTGLTAGVGGALAERGRRVLLVDLDPQGHLSAEALGLDDQPASGPSLAGALAGTYEGPTVDLAVEHSRTPAGGHIDVLANSLAMFTVGRALDQLPAREWRLARLLDVLDGVYDHCLIDSPPALDILTDNALAACHGVVIPVQLERTSIRALRLLTGQISGLENVLRRDRIEIHGLVPSLYRRPLHRLADSVMHQLESLPLPIVAHLPLGVAVPEAWASGQTVTDYAPGCEHAAQYRRIADVLDEAAGLAVKEAP